MNQEINQEIIQKYWQEVLQITRELNPDGQFSASEVIDYLNAWLPEGSKSVTKTKVNYLRTEGIKSWRGKGEDKLALYI